MRDDCGCPVAPAAGEPPEPHACRSEAAISGVVVFRLRRRGAALEAAVCEQIVPAGDDRTAPGLVRQVLRETGADHAVQIGRARPSRGLLPVPGQGPTLVWRDVSDSVMPPADRWALGLGDIELF